MRIMAELIGSIPMLVPSHIKIEGNKVADYMENVGTSIISKLIDDILTRIVRETFTLSFHALATKDMDNHSLNIHNLGGNG